MTHQRVSSSYIYSLAHDGVETMEVRFRCPRCSGAGGECTYCGGRGHTGTCTGKVPERVFVKIMKGPSIGGNYQRFVKSVKAADGSPAYSLQKLDNLPPEAGAPQDKVSCF